MNATVLQTRIDKIVDEFGNTMEYNAPITTEGTTWYNSEGDWKEVYATTTLLTKWIEADTLYRNEFREMGIFDLKSNEAIVKGSESFIRKGKCVSNSITWEIEEIKPIRIKDILVAQTISLKNSLS